MTGGTDGDSYDAFSFSKASEPHALSDGTFGCRPVHALVQTWEAVPAVVRERFEPFQAPSDLESVAGLREHLAGIQGGSRVVLPRFESRLLLGDLAVAVERVDEVLVTRVNH